MNKNETYNAPAVLLTFVSRTNREVFIKLWNDPSFFQADRTLYVPDFCRVRGFTLLFHESVLVGDVPDAVEWSMNLKVIAGCVAGV